nr:cytochrome P450 [Rhizohabitans arisaemae]
MPFDRSTYFDPPPRLAEYRRESPIRRLAFTDGHLGWLVTGYDTARAVLADPRFSNRDAFLHPIVPPEFTNPLQTGGFPPSFFLFTDPPDHTRYRKPLTGHFTVRRMRLLQERVAQIVEERLAEMERLGPPLDLVAEFALPIPSLVICELLGVPYTDRAAFQRDSRLLTDFTTTAEEAAAALGSLGGYLYELILRKRATPTDDLLGELASAEGFTVEEIIGMSMLLLIAGYETTANLLGLGTLALLDNPGQLALLRDDPSVADGAVEELLRHLSVVTVGSTRSATEDVEIGGHTIAAGETVVVSLAAANRDPLRFDSPDDLDLTRQAPGHLAFGHGIHQCLGQQLARIELKIAFPALIRRFPGLRLADPGAPIPVRTYATVHGVERLPVTW